MNINYIPYRWLLTLAATALLASACQFTTANIERAVMARAVTKDKEPVNETSSFHMHENLLHCCVSMANTPTGTKVKAIWRVDGDKEDRAVIDSFSVEMENSTWIDFSLTLTKSGLPYGSYAVDLFIDDEFKQSVPFTVEPMFEGSVVKEAVLATGLNENYYPTEVVTSFPAGIDMIYAPVYVDGQPAGSVFSSAWYQHDEAGARTLITGADINFDETGWIGFSMKLTDGLPAGKYSVDILHNGSVEQTLEFAAQ